MNYFVQKSTEKVLRKMRWNLEMCKKSEKCKAKCGKLYWWLVHAWVGNIENVGKKRKK